MTQEAMLEDTQAVRAAPRARPIIEPVTQDDLPFQKQRRRLLGGLALGFFLLSLFLELDARGIDPREALSNVIDVFTSFLSPGAGFSGIDMVANVRGFIAVLRNTVPALAMFMLVLWLGERFVQAVYGTSSRKEASEYLRNSIFGGVVGFGPFIVKLLTTLVLEPLAGDLIRPRPFLIVREGKTLGSEYQPAARIGGPARLVIANDSAVLLEQMGRLTRVLGPGFHALWRFEKIRTIVDLRPRWYEFNVNGMSLEGIPIKWTIDIHFQINDQGENRHEATDEMPYAFSEEAVFKAATDYWLRESERSDHLDWHGRLVVGEAEPKLRDIIAQYSLDKLIRFKQGTPLARMQNLTRPQAARTATPRQTIRQELEVELQKAAVNHGARILDVKLRNIELEDPVAQQWLNTWKAEWDKRRKIELARGTAERVRQLEKVKADAQREMILAITEGFNNVRQNDLIDPEVVLLRFIECVRSQAVDPQVYLFSPQPGLIINALTALRDLLDSGQAGS